jgi:hypothetical protein
VPGSGFDSGGISTFRQQATTACLQTRSWADDVCNKRGSARSSCRGTAGVDGGYAMCWNGARGKRRHGARAASPIPALRSDVCQAGIRIIGLSRLADGRDCSVYLAEVRQAPSEFDVEDFRSDLTSPRVHQVHARRERAFEHQRNLLAAF